MPFLILWSMASPQALVKNGDFAGGAESWSFAGTNADRVFGVAEEVFGGVRRRVMEYHRGPDLPEDNHYAYQSVRLEGDARYRLQVVYRALDGLRPVVALLTQQFQVAHFWVLPESATWATFDTNFYLEEAGGFRLQLFAGAMGRVREAAVGRSAWSRIQLSLVEKNLSSAVEEGMASMVQVPGVRWVEAPGWDWSLPPGTRAAEGSGFSTWGARRFSPLVTIRGVFMPWKRLAPGEGVLDFKPILDEIESNRVQGLATGLHLMNAERKYVPDWVVEKYRAPVIDAALLSSNQPWRMSFVPPWHPGVMAEWEKLLLALGASGIPQRADILYAYMNGVGASRGEELFLRAVDADQWSREAGLTPALYSNWLYRRADAMLGAFSGVEGKLAWMSPEEAITSVPGYREATAGLQEHVLRRGAGYRGGGIDFQHSLFVAPAAGSSIVEAYAVLDETAPAFQGNRIRGDENEEYGKDWEWRFGPVASHAYRHRICTLHSLALQQNVVFVSPDTLRLNPELNQYAAARLGLRRSEAPDAWCYLRECTTRGLPKVKNLEQWLFQRDIPGAFTKACRKTDRAPLPMDPPGQHWDFDARRTEWARNQRHVAFRLDSGFLGAPCKVVVKISFMDENGARWRLEYSDGAKLLSTPEYLGKGDGQLKTATIALPRLAADRRFRGGMDFRITVIGDQDGEFTFVRLVKD